LPHPNIHLFQTRAAHSVLSLTAPGAAHQLLARLYPVAMYAPRRERSAQYGHSIEFFAPLAPAALIASSRLISYARHSVSVPSASALNVPARVTLRLPAGTSENAARDWCTRRHRPVSFVGFEEPQAGPLPAVIFEVEGFSRYGFPESPAPKHPVDGTAALASAHKRIVVPAFDDDDDDDDDVDDYAGTIFESKGAHYDEGDETDSGRMDVRYARVDLSQTRRVAHALFSGEDAENDVKLAVEARRRSFGDKGVQKEDPFPWRRAVVPFHLRDGEGTGDEEDEDEDVSDAGWDLPSVPLTYARNWLPHPPLAKSIFAGRAHGFQDPSLAFGRSFRVTFDECGHVFCPRWADEPAHRFVVDRRRVVASTAVAARQSFVPPEAFIRALRVHAVTWALSRPPCSGTDAEDTFQPQVPSLSLAFASAPGVADSAMDKLLDAFAIADEHGDDANSGHAGVVFGLLAALYRQPRDPTDNLLRRVVTWLAGDAGTAYDPPVPAATGLPRALALLTIGDIDSAVQTAAEAGYLRLAVMMARAAESDKEALRADALSQLEVYGVVLNGHMNSEEDEDEDDVELDDLLMQKRRESSGANSAVPGHVTGEERLIMCLLAGKVGPVARILGLSWYRVFGMELLFGAGSSDRTYAERISSAVTALTRPGIGDHIPAVPPHGAISHRDAAYHLLRLYADPTASYSLYAGVYSPSSYGTVNNPLDMRFAWLLHETLSAIVPQAALVDPMRLSDAFVAQLSAAGLPLWSFYVFCSGGPPASAVKETLIRRWPSISQDRIELSADLVGEDVGKAASKEDNDDTTGADMDIDSGTLESMQACTFLLHVLRIPAAWIHEARAVECGMEGDVRGACEQWLKSETIYGMSRAQELIADTLFPLANSLYDAEALGRIAMYLRVIDQAKRLPDWSTRGGLILDYLTHVCGDTIAPSSVAAVTARSAEERKQIMAIFKSMAQRVSGSMTHARTSAQRHAVITIADGIASAQRVVVLYCVTSMEETVEDLERMPVSAACARRICDEFRHQSTKGGFAGAAMFATAMPVYSTFLGRKAQRTKKDAELRNSAAASECAAIVVTPNGLTE
jgi:Nuclear protein 96